MLYTSDFLLMQIYRKTDFNNNFLKRKIDNCLVFFRKVSNFFTLLNFF